MNQVLCQTRCLINQAEVTKGWDFSSFYTDPKNGSNLSLFSKIIPLLRISTPADSKKVLWDYWRGCRSGSVWAPEDRGSSLTPLDGWTSSSSLWKGGDSGKVQKIWVNYREPSFSYRASLDWFLSRKEKFFPWSRIWPRALNLLKRKNPSFVVRGHFYGSVLRESELL